MGGGKGGGRAGDCVEDCCADGEGLGGADYWGEG